MRERNAIIILVGLLILIGISLVYFLAFKSEFNFYKSEISIDGNAITEKLSFKPDKPYHTLYRDFVSEIQPYKSAGNYQQQGVEEKITVRSITCSAGQAYLKIFGGCYQPSQNGLVLMPRCPARSLAARLAGVAQSRLDGCLSNAR